MPQASYIYANARVGVAQTRLLTLERINRLQEAKNADEALRVLVEVGYGGNKEVQSAFDFQQLINEELKKAYDFIYEITPNKEVTDLFLVQFDYHNIKALIKNRLLDLEDDTQLFMVGTEPVDKIKAAVRDRDYRSLPKHLAKTLDALDQKLAGRINPQALDTFVDQAMFRYIFEVMDAPEFEKHVKKVPFLSDYFEALCDFANVITFLRARSAKLTREAFAALLMTDRNVSRHALLEAYDQPLEGIGRLLASGAAASYISRGLDKYLESGSTAQMERLRDDFLLDLVKRHKNNTFGIEPVIGYILAREQEARVVRLVMTAKLNNIPADVVQERVRELYV
ncbi:MAG: V-type ATPase subunit [Bacillota bacterium]